MANKTIVLFQGDSITDCNRFSLPPYGDGYVSKVVKALPQLEIINRGISGNRVIDLKERWKEDALDLHPDVLVIMIGVNEVWHYLSYGKEYSDSQYEKDYRLILDELKHINPKLKIVMMQPFLFEVGVVKADWVAPLDRLKLIVKRIAHEKADAYIPLQEILDEATKVHSKDALLPDGVHPSDLGHQLIANEVTKVLQKII
jgi:lysophospholipase L1-like esterase